MHTAFISAHLKCWFGYILHTKGSVILYNCIFNVILYVLLIYCSLFNMLEMVKTYGEDVKVKLLIYGHELSVVTERKRSWIKTAHVYVCHTLIR